MAQLIVAFMVLTSFAGAAAAQQTYSYSKPVQRACANDYKKHCGQYGIERQALRLAWTGRGTAYQRRVLTLWSRMVKSASRRWSAGNKAAADI
jgi:hypothetical protein